jgi:hypothetical protein
LQFLFVFPSFVLISRFSAKYCYSKSSPYLTRNTSRLRDISIHSVPHRKKEVKVKFILRPTVTRPVCLGVRHPSVTPQPIFALHSLIIVKQLRVFCCGATSLTRGRVCIFQFLLGIESAVLLRSQSRGTHEHILLSQFLRLPQPGGPGSCIYFPQEQGGPVISPTGNTLRLRYINIQSVSHRKQIQVSYIATDGQSASSY